MSVFSFRVIDLFDIIFRNAINLVITTYNSAIKISRLWAEVFHVSASGAGTVKWQQVSEDLVPVNITCIQDSPECIFHITAYNSQVDKILDVRLVQPGKMMVFFSFSLVYTLERRDKYFRNCFQVHGLDKRQNVSFIGKTR